MNPTTLLKKPIVLIVIGVLLAMLFLSSISSGGVFDSWNTTGELWTAKGLEFGTNFDTATIIGSWKDGYNSETFTITGKAREATASLGGLKSYRYALYVEGSNEVKKYGPNGDDWIAFPSTWSLSNDWYYLQSWTTSVPTTGAIRLKVVLEVKLTDVGFLNYEYTDPNDLAWDGALVRSGMGCLELHSSTPSPIEVGGKVNLYVETGYTGGAGWSLAIQPPALRTDLPQTPNIIKTFPDNTWGTVVSWVVPEGAFKENDDPLMNEWKAILLNQYFAQSWTSIFTIDQLDRAPLITNVEVTANANSFTYTVTCQETYAPIGGVLVNAWYSYGGVTKPGPLDTSSWLIKDLKVPVSNNVATFSVTGTNIAGTIIVEIIAYDTGGRTSAIDYEAFVWDGVGGGYIVPPPYEQGFIWTTEAMIIAVLIVIGILALLFFAPVPIEYKIGIAIALVAAGAYAIWMFGTLQWGV